MMGEPGVHDRRERWVARSVLFVVGLSVLSLVVGMLLLPGTQGDFSASGIWASICRAAGVPGRSPDDSATGASGVPSTTVVMSRAMARPGSSESIGRGATLALRCTMCHGARGLSEANAPNLAGQYAEVIVKQLTDFKHADRRSAVMQALTSGLSERDMTDLAAYYSYLPRPTNLPLRRDDVVPALVDVGAPMRNIAPCASCHGGIDHKLGAPWLEGMPSEYLAAQLSAFAAGSRANDSHAQMRNMARTLTPGEISALSGFYAGQAGESSAPPRVRE